MKPIVPLLVAACAVVAAQSVSAQTSATWQSPVNVTASPGALQKSGGCDGCPDSGAHSSQQLSGDGYVDFIPGMDQRLYAGVTTDLSSSTASTTMNFAFSFWPGGAWEIRELGVYKSEGTFAAGDHFSVSVENGVVIYRHNGVAVYRSATAPAFPLALDTTFYSTGSSLSGATIGAGVPPNATTAPPPATTTTPTTTTTATTQTTATTTNPDGVAARTAVGPYYAVVDRYAYPKPAVPALGPAGTTIHDPVFGSSITRLTDGNTRPGYLNRSFRTPSGTHSLAWSANGTKFYVVSTDGTVIPFTFDAATHSAKRIQPTTSGEGGLVLRFYLEPQFSFVNDSVIYGSSSLSGSTLRTVDKYDFSTGQYSTIFNLDAVQPGLSGTFIGGLGSSAGPNERILAFFGGTSQDKHHYAVVFDVANPSAYQIVDTLTSTVNGGPAPITLNFSLHHASIDRSGRYVILYPTGPDMQAPRYAAQMYVWDTVTGAMTALGASAHPYGHDAYGYGVAINQDCCTSTTWDAAQWQLRDFSTPTVSHDLIATVLSPKETSLADHPSWNNARSDRLVPYVSGLYRYGTNTSPWRAWDDELVAIQTDGAPGSTATVWRFAHHRSDIRNDLDATTTYFWYEPRPNISPDGHWVLFTSNWEKTLGTDPGGDAGGSFRQDVFLLELTPSTSASTTTTTTASPPPPPAPTVAPVSIATSSVPGAQMTVPYSAAVTATGGSGSYSWTIAQGTLPPGLLLNRTLGVISGTPTTAGSFPFAVTASDAANTANSATTSYTLVVSGPPLQITTLLAPTARETVAYSAALTASGGSGSYNWSLSSGTLPPGLTFSPQGSLSGVPTTPGTYTFIVRVADAQNAALTASMSYSIPVQAAVKILAPPSTLTPLRNTPFAYAFVAANIIGNAAWTMSGNLPQGLTFNSTSGILSGTPRTGGSTTVRITVSDASSTCTIAVALKITQK
jgi:hypothetical protein